MKMFCLLNKSVNLLLGKYYQVVVSKKAVKQSKLVMTLLARDEADIIEANILFHLSRGVDFIVATDNGSSDGTADILRKYEKRGVLHLIHEPSRVFDQAAWVNRMGRIAHNQYGADLVFHCDADEFWYPGSGSLKNELLARPLVDVLSAKVVNVILRNRNGEERFPFDAIYAATNPLPKSRKKSQLSQDRHETSLLLYKHAGKVIYKLRKGYLPVGWGNHSIRMSKELSSYYSGTSHDINVFHFPVRGFGQFVKRTANHGEGHQNFHGTAAGAGLSDKGLLNKKWYEIYKSGKLFDEFNRLNMTESEAKKRLDTGVITTKDRRLQVLVDFIAHPQRNLTS